LQSARLVAAVAELGSLDDFAMRAPLTGFAAVTISLVLVSCTAKRQAELHFQRGFEQPTNALTAMVTYNGRQIYVGAPSANPLTGHPHVVKFTVGQEERGTLEIAVSSVVTQSFEMVWSKGMGVGFQFTNGIVTCTQPVITRYSLE
jgi:hypothetical protein